MPPVHGPATSPGTTLLTSGLSARQFSFAVLLSTSQPYSLALHGDCGCHLLVTPCWPWSLQYYHDHSAIA